MLRIHVYIEAESINVCDMQATTTQLTIPEKDKKMVRLHPDVHKELGELVERKGESYNDIIKRLVKFYKQHKQQRT